MPEHDAYMREWMEAAENEERRANARLAAWMRKWHASARELAHNAIHKEAHDEVR